MGLTLLLLTSTTVVLAEKQDKKDRPQIASLPPGSRIAVIANGSSGGNQVDRIVGEMLTTALVHAGVRVYERQNLSAVLQEQQLGRQGVLNPKTAPPSGQVTGVQYLLDVKATEFGIRHDRVGGAIALGPIAGLQVRTRTARVVLDARLINTRTGSVITTATAQGKDVNTGGTLIGGMIDHGIFNLGAIDIGSSEWSQSSLGKASRKAVNGLVKKLIGILPANEGTVMGVLPDNTIVIQFAGVGRMKPGDRLKVDRLVQYRNKEGTVIWTQEEPIGEVRVVAIEGDHLRAAAVIPGTHFAEGDLVKLPD